MRIEKTEQGKTKNGLRYYLFPRTGFGEQMAAVLVQRGANHLFWKGRDGEKICFPQGTAHFIEHKLFQQEWGDAFARFTQNGASANAFTDGDRTVYYFTCSDKFTENLRLLLDFVQKPYFTKEDTERERDIIVSEITMYEDDPMWVGHYQMLECMYGKHPIRNRIAGTAETVAEITEKTLGRTHAITQRTKWHWSVQGISLWARCGGWQSMLRDGKRLHACIFRQRMQRLRRNIARVK